MAVAAGAARGARGDRGGRPSPFRLLVANPLSAAGLVLLAAILLLALVVPWLPLPDPDITDPARRLLRPGVEGHLLGTDQLGRDLLSRLLWGTRVSIAVGLSATLIAAFVGSLIGLVAGYAGGLADRVLMRVNDAVIALPLLPLLIVLAAVDLGKLGLPPEIATSENVSLYRIVVIVSLFGWNTVARLVRAETLALRQREFVRAAVALGTTPRSIMWRHILPNAVSPIIVATTLSVGQIILFESTLSFLGLGIQPPTASWGNMLTNAQEVIWSAPELAVWPGLLIFLTVIAFNFLGDGLQDALDPRALD
jgi:peptide/nickel transport system permease protein